MASRSLVIAALVLCVSAQAWAGPSWKKQGSLILPNELSSHYWLFVSSLEIDSAGLYVGTEYAREGAGDAPDPAKKLWNLMLLPKGSQTWRKFLISLERGVLQRDPYSRSKTTPVSFKKLRSIGEKKLIGLATYELTEEDSLHELLSPRVLVKIELNDSAEPTVTTFGPEQVPGSHVLGYAFVNGRLFVGTGPSNHERNFWNLYFPMTEIRELDPETLRELRSMPTSPEALGVPAQAQFIPYILRDVEGGLFLQAEFTHPNRRKVQGVYQLDPNSGKAVTQYEDFEGVSLSNLVMVDGGLRYLDSHFNEKQRGGSQDRTLNYSDFDPNTGPVATRPVLVDKDLKLQGAKGFGRYLFAQYSNDEWVCHLPQALLIIPCIEGSVPEGETFLTIVDSSGKLLERKKVIPKSERGAHQGALRKLTADGTVYLDRMMVKERTFAIDSYQAQGLK